MEHFREGMKGVEACAIHPPFLVPSEPRSSPHLLEAALTQTRATPRPFGKGREREVCSSQWIFPQNGDCAPMGKVDKGVVMAWISSHEADKNQPGIRRRDFLQQVLRILGSAALVTLGPWREGHVGAQGCDQGPINPRDSRNGDLDRQAPDWGVYCEGSPMWRLQNVATPSLDTESLQCSLLGGVGYSNAHFYRIFTSEPTSIAFTITLSFRFTPTTCNNAGSPSIIQGLEFTMSKFYQNIRWEFGLQWENVAASVNNGAPQWRFWNGSHWVRLNRPLSQCLQGEQWHEFTIVGQIINDNVFYDRFVIDKQVHVLDITVPPVPAIDVVRDDRLAIGVQLDGNFQESPYDVFLDKVNFIRGPVPIPPLTLSLNQATFRPGDVLRVGLRAQNPGSAFNADFYFGVLLPDSVTLFFFTNLSPLNGIVTRVDADSRTFQPLAANVLVPERLDITINDLLTAVLSDGLQPGTYILFAVFTPPRAFSDAGVDRGALLPIATQSFTFSP